MNPILTGQAVTEALRSAHARQDIDAMRKICGQTPDDVLIAIGDGDMEIRGDSRDGFEVWTIDRRFLVPTKTEGRERIQRDDWVEVTGKPEGHVERVERGMLRSMSCDYFLDDVTLAGERQSVEGARLAE